MRRICTDVEPRVSKLCCIQSGKGWAPSEQDRAEQALLGVALVSGQFDRYSDEAWCALCERLGG